MNIGIVVWSLLENRGGIERNGCDLARAMLDRGHAVTLFCKKMTGDAVFPVPDGAVLVPLSLDYDTACINDAAAAIAACDLDVMAAIFSWDSLLWFPGLLKGSGVPLLISERSAPEYINSKWNAYERLCCLDTADGIHILLRGFMKEYPDRFHSRINVVPNPAFLTPPVRPASRPADARRLIIAAGRFVEDAKQFSLLLKAFALLKDSHPDWDLEICGDGESMAAYRKLANTLGLGERLRLPGMVSDLPSRYAAADIFCIPSKFEGFGMVTVEAQAQALPAVGFAACPGTNEIIVHGENGLLAEAMTAQSLAGSLAVLMRDEGLRRRMGKRGKAMLERYAPDRVYDAWEAMLRKTAERKGRTRSMEIEGPGGATDAQTLATRQLLARPHPFDRSGYLELHERLKRDGHASPFTEKEAAAMLRKQKKIRLLRLQDAPGGDQTPGAQAVSRLPATACRHSRIIQRPGARPNGKQSPRPTGKPIERRYGSLRGSGR